MSNIKSEQAEKKNNHGKILCEIKQYGNAKIFFTEAIELNPSEAKYWNNRSACNLTMGFYVQALYDARKSVSLDSKYVNGHKRYAKCCKLLDNLDSALSILEKAKNIDPLDKAIQEELECVRKLTDINVNVQSDLKVKNYKKSLVNIDKYLGTVPYSKKYILLKAECLIYLQKYSEVHQVLNPLLKNSEDEDLLYIQGLCSFYGGYIIQTFESLKQIKIRIPDNKKMSDLYKKAKKILHYLNLIADSTYTDAYVWYGEAIEVDPDNFVTNKTLLYNKIKIGLECPDLFNKVILDCADYLDVYLKDINVLKIRAKCNMQVQEYEDAIEDYTEIIKMEDNEENKELLQKAEECFTEQCKNNYRILYLNDNETNERKIQKAYQELLLAYHVDGNVSIERREKLEKKVRRIQDSYNEIIQNLACHTKSSEDFQDTYKGEYPVREKLENIQDAKKLIDQYEFACAREIINKIIDNNPKDLEAIYTLALCVFYEEYITHTFDRLKELKRKIPEHTKMAELYKKAEKTFEIANHLEKALENKQERQAYDFINEALMIDLDNITTNKSLFFKKIEIVSHNPHFKQDTYRECSYYLNEYGADIEVLKIRAKFCTETNEYEDAMDDYEEMLNLENNEENDSLYREALSRFNEESKSSARILRISEDEVNPEKIKAAYLRLVLLYHPDKNPKVNDERKKKLEKKLIRIRKAYENMEKA